MNFYARRRERLIDDGLLSPALEVAEAFQTEGKLDKIELVEIIKNAGAADDEAVMEVLKELTHSGFVWNPPESALYEPGILSLMSFIIEQRQRLSRSTHDRDDHRK